MKGACMHGRGRESQTSALATQLDIHGQKSEVHENTYLPHPQFVRTFTTHYFCYFSAV